MEKYIKNAWIPLWHNFHSIARQGEMEERWSSANQRSTKKIFDHQVGSFDNWYSKNIFAHLVGSFDIWYLIFHTQKIYICSPGWQFCPLPSFSCLPPGSPPYRSEKSWLLKKFHKLRSLISKTLASTIPIWKNTFLKKNSSVKKCLSEKIPLRWKYLSGKYLSEKISLKKYLSEKIPLW